MRHTKTSALAAVAAALAYSDREAIPLGEDALPMGEAVPQPMPPMLFKAPLKLAPANKGRSNNKAGARLKDRERAKAAHRARMAQKRKK